MEAAARTSAAVRWGGTVLALCASTFTVTMILYVAVYGQPAVESATVADQAAHMLERWRLISTLWVVEAIAWVLLAVAGFVLQQRPPSGPAWLPSRAAWLAVGVGAVVQGIMYSFTLGAYPVAAAEITRSPALFPALREAATVLFHLGNLAVFAGLGGVFVGEWSTPSTVPRWIAISGAVACFATALLLVGLLAGFGDMLFAAPGALVGYLATVYLGWSIRRNG